MNERTDTVHEYVVISRRTAEIFRRFFVLKSGGYLCDNIHRVVF